jgi:hypothetical protein
VGVEKPEKEQEINLPKIPKRLKYAFSREQELRLDWE